MKRLKSQQYVQMYSQTCPSRQVFGNSDLAAIIWNFGDELDWGHHWHKTNKTYYKLWTTVQFLVERFDQRDKEALGMYNDGWRGRQENPPSGPNRSDYDLYSQRRYADPKCLIFEAKRQMILRQLQINHQIRYCDDKKCFRYNALICDIPASGTLALLRNMVEHSVPWSLLYQRDALTHPLSKPTPATYVTVEFKTFEHYGCCQGNVCGTRMCSDTVYDSKLPPQKPACGHRLCEDCVYVFKEKPDQVSILCCTLRKCKKDALQRAKVPAEDCCSIPSCRTPLSSNASRNWKFENCNHVFCSDNCQCDDGYQDHDTELFFCPICGAAESAEAFNKLTPEDKARIAIEYKQWKQARGNTQNVEGNPAGMASA